MTNYEHLAAVLRALTDSPPGGQWTDTFLRERTGLSDDELAGVFGGMRERGWLADGPFKGETYRLVGLGRDHAGKNGAQLLACDVLAAIRATGTDAATVDTLPANLGADKALLELALTDLEREGAAMLHRTMRGGFPFDSIVVKPGGRTYGVPTARATPAAAVHQHIGDIVGRDKNTNSGSGAIVTGNNVTMSTDEEAADALRRLVGSLRAQGSLASDALDTLDSVALPDASRHAVTGAATEAVLAEPRLRDKLKTWVSGLPGHLGRAAIVEGIKVLLKAQGVL